MAVSSHSNLGFQLLLFRTPRLKKTKNLSPNCVCLPPLPTQDELCSLTFSLTPCSSPHDPTKCCSRVAERAAQRMRNALKSPHTLSMHKDSQTALERHNSVFSFACAYTSLTVRTRGVAGNAIGAVQNLSRGQMKPVRQKQRVGETDHGHSRVSLFPKPSHAT